MYPFLRLALQMVRARSAPPLGVLDVHMSRHLCLPWDLDGFGELNNGRVLTLYDLGRFGMASRIGLFGVLRRRRWGLAVAGASVRYRRRITAFQRIEMRTRVAGWDARFFYIMQSMWVGGVCCSEALLRTAVVARGRSVASAEVAGELGLGSGSPAMPAWIVAWVEAEGMRPWPPEEEEAPSGDGPRAM